MEYVWAKNRVKLQLAIDLVKAASKLDSKIVVDEDTIKSRYLAMAGKIADVEAVEESVEAPKKRVRKSK